MLTLTDSRLCEARVDTGALRDNARVLRGAAGAQSLLVDVSADGHGHGAIETVMAALEGGAQWLSVSTVADAVALRESGIRVPILTSFAMHCRAEVPDVFLRGDPAVPELFAAGVSLYGVGPELSRLRLRPAMRVSATVLTTKTIQPGDGVSYGYTFRAEKVTNLAMIAIGYADGLDRRAGNTASVMLGGRPRRIVGRVAMNAAVLDLGADESAPGEEAVVFGGSGEPSADSWAQSLDITADEVVTVFGQRLTRSYR
ncbi:alanine racemase [Parafrigoribacterium soli]|uniref:alanine racemase n=1 Tax=Parafrigoribacterium soli TaxID=3144663 RepID=UPI0032EEB646